jgi:intein/homing endonuclease
VDRRKVECNIPKDFSIELAELIGLIFSDGCINWDGTSFYNKDVALLNRFQYLAFEVFNLNKPHKRERRPGFFEINYYSMDMVGFLNKLIHRKSLIPEQIWGGSKDIKTSFLRGYFSGDGSVILSVPNKKFYHKFQINSFLHLACRRMNITKIIGEIFESLGYHVIIRNDGLQIHKFKDIFNFYREIGLDLKRIKYLNM